MKTKRLGSIPKGLAWLEEVLQEDAQQESIVSITHAAELSQDEHEDAVHMPSEKKGTAKGPSMRNAKAKPTAMLEPEAVHTESAQAQEIAREYTTKPFVDMPEHHEDEDLVELSNYIPNNYGAASNTTSFDTKPSSQVGLPKGWTRATLIVKEEHLKKLKAMAYWDRVTIKFLMDQALSAFLDGKRVRSLNVKKV